MASSYFLPCSVLVAVLLLSDAAISQARPHAVRPLPRRPTGTRGPHASGKPRPFKDARVHGLNTAETSLLLS
jgi:hypothetical protein